MVDPPSSPPPPGGSLDDGEAPTLEEKTIRGRDASVVSALSAQPKVSDLPPGVSRYELLGALGAGAMGAVNLVRDRRLGRDVAMKVIRGEHATDPDAQLRFEREARVQGQLEHAAIVPVHDIGTTPDGAVFFTMKRVQGESLRAILKGLRVGDPAITSRYGPRRLLAAFGTVCLAVALAHSRGILHRDIKPANIMFGDFGEVYLLDWGVAKVRRAGPLEATQEGVIALPGGADAASKAGDVLGTVGYMAPEQALGQPVDERADVYSLGATLFEILTLERLHPVDVVGALSSTLHGVEARPSVRAPGRTVARELEELCVAATALDREARPGDARDMYEIIERVLDGDRDLERRRKLSSEHTAVARAEAARALAAGPGAAKARERAIQEVHRAIVLDGANVEAVEILTELARDPAGEVTGDADDALYTATRHMRRELAAMGALLFVPWLVGIGIGAALGLRRPLVLGFGALLLMTGAALSWARTRVENGFITLGALFCADLSAAITGAAFSPFVLVPGLLACTAIAFTVASSPLQGVPERERGSRLIRHAAVLFGLLAFIVPLLLEWAGVLPPSVVIRDDAIVLLPRAVDFPPTWTIAFLVVVNVVLILVPALLASRIRDHTLRAEREAFSSMAKMRHLLPSVAKTVIARETEPKP